MLAWVMNLGFAAGGSPGPPPPSPPTFAQYYFGPPSVGGGPLPPSRPMSARRENLMSASLITRALWEQGQIDQKTHDKIVADIRNKLRGRVH